MAREIRHPLPNEGVEVHPFMPRVLRETPAVTTHERDEMLIEVRDMLDEIRNCDHDLMSLRSRVETLLLKLEATP